MPLLDGYFVQFSILNLSSCALRLQYLCQDFRRLGKGGKLIVLINEKGLCEI